MKNEILRRPVQLEQFLDNLIAGDDKHQQDKPLPKEIRAELVATRDTLKSLNHSVQSSNGQLRQSTDDRREFLAEAIEKADKFRATVGGLHGSKGAELIDYRLATRRKPRKAGSAEAVGVSTEESNARRASVHLARMQGQLEKLNARRSALEARIVKQEAKVASAPVVTPPAATPAPEPTSESGTK